MFARKSKLYYWAKPEAQYAIEYLIKNLGDKHLPYSLLIQFVGVTDL